MIDKNSALFSVPLAMLAASKGLVVSPVEGTPLSELVKSTNDMLLCAGQCVANDETDATQLMNFAETVGAYSTADEETAHDTTMDSFTSEISKAVANHISFAKNVVKPVIIVMVDEVQKAMGEVVCPSSNFKIEIVDLPKPMQNAGFETSINKFAEKPLLPPEGELRLGEISPQGILELMKTGSKEYDERISEWFVVKGDLFFMDIWNNLFRDFKEGKPSTVFGFAECLSNQVDAVDFALAIHLLSRKLYDEVPENTGLSLAAFRNLAAQYREASGVKLNQEYLRYANILQNKILVSFISNDSKTCKVNGAVYRDWLKAGGSNEVLLGMLVGNKTVYSQALIDEDKQKFITDWNSYSLFNITAEKNKSFNRFKDILTLSFGNLLNNQSTEEKENTDQFPLFKSKVEECFLNELNNLKSGDMNDIYNVCTKLVCRARFYYTDSEKILVGINDAVKANPNIDIREAALLSTIEYVTDFISDQLKISTI